MSAATPTAMYSTNSSQSGLNVAGAFPQTTGQGVGGQNLDLIQIVGLGGSILLNVDYLGTVHNPAVAPTTSAGGIGQTRVGQFQTNLSSTATTAQLFASAFANPSLLDILQIVNEGGNIHYNLNYLGVASGS
jgi:hypothetical protein